MPETKPSAENNNYRYYAFISYSRKDKEWGEWVQKKIENYRLPTALRQENSQNDIPKFVRPVFRNSADSASQEGLNCTVKQELQQSKFLIVICSPYSAQPDEAGKHEVNEEIEEFQRMGRGHRIIPLIVEGNPESDDSSVQCYPPALNNLEDKPLGISVHENANATSSIRPVLRRFGLDTAANNALLKILAVLLGIRYDSLKRRHHIRARRRALMNSAVVCFCMALGFWYYDANYREKVYYYTDYVERFGVPEGIFPLDKTTADKREHFYRFVYVGGKLQEWAALNGDGKLQKHADYWDERPSKALFSDYDSNERPKTVRYFNEHGEEILYFVWTQDRKAIDFKPSRAIDNNSPLAMPANMANLINKRKDRDVAEKKSAIIRFLYEYDAAGFATKVSFMSSVWEGDVTSDANGVYGYLFERNAHNAIVKKTFMNADGKPMYIKNGTSSIVFDYTKEGLIESVRFLDIAGNLVKQAEGYAKIVVKYTPEGKISEMQLIGADEKVYAIIKAVLDSRGHAVEMHFLDAKYNLFLNAAGFAKIKYKFDDSGNEIEESYFNLKGEPVLIAKGYATRRKQYDAQNRVTEEAYFDIDGKAILNHSGFAKIQTKYDSKGNIIEQSYVGLDGKGLLVDGFAKISVKYDDKENAVEMAVYGLEGQPTLSTRKFAKMIMEYDARGNKIHVAFVDTHGKPIMSSFGCASAAFAYDSQGNVTEVKKYDAEGKPIKD